MKIQIIFIILLSSYIFCLEENEDISNTKYIVFSTEGVKFDGSGIEISNIIETTVLITKPGMYFVTGESEEGNIVIKSDSVTLYLQDLFLTSKINAPIIVTKNKKNIRIINIDNTKLKDLEDPLSTEGECAVIKINENSNVLFSNKGEFKLYGNCKNIIRGLSQVSIIFEKSDGEYIIKANETAINSDGLLVFNGGKFTISSLYGDAIKSSPKDKDVESQGKILINDGEFDIKSYNDAFSAKYNITILKGNFDIITQDGFDGEINQNVSSKGFKVTDTNEGSGIRIHSGIFNLNTADDAIRSNRDITILKGKFEINAGDDAICAKFHLNLGEKDGSLDDLDIKIYNSFEALEGMVIKIYSGRILATSSDDGINASGVIKKAQNQRNNWNWNYTRNGTGRDNRTQWPPFNISDWPDFNYSDRYNNRNRTRNGTNGGRTHRGGTPGNGSYIISVFGGEIDVYSKSDGIDSNGNIYIHGGSLNIFSKGEGSDAPLDHNGNLTLFNADLLGVGTWGFESVHEGIKKGNQLYAYYDGDFLSEGSRLEIQNEKEETIREKILDKDIDYIFFTSSKLNKNYHFYIYDKITEEKKELNMTYEYPATGDDDEDLSYSNEDGEKSSDRNKIDEKKDEEDNNTNFSFNLITSFILYIYALLI